MFDTPNKVSGPGLILAPGFGDIQPMLPLGLVRHGSRYATARSFVQAFPSTPPLIIVIQPH